MQCYKCKKKLDIANNKIGFKDICSFCETDLHVCKNCKYYQIGKPNDCLVPNTEYVKDREKNNFCEEFSYRQKLEEINSKTKKDVSNKLFKDDNDDDENRSFDSLFKK